MKDVLDFLGGALIAGCFCFTISTIRSCAVEHEKIKLERLKIPHKIHSSHSATVESSGAPKEQP
jgi:hypothetical protein